MPRTAIASTRSGSRSGLRLGEALGLQRTDIDWKRNTLSVRRMLQRDRKGAGLLLTEMKTTGSRRTLTLPTETAAALQAHRDRQDFERRRASAEWLERGLIFSTSLGTPLDQGRIHHHWQSATNKAGLPRYRIHDLRHSVASDLIAGGLELLEVAHLLGHRNATMVTQMYGHVAPGDHRRAASLMERLLERNKPVVV